MSFQGGIQGVGLRLDPIGGGQFQQAINGIIEAEKQPIKTLESRKSKEDTRLKLFQEFKTKFTTLEKPLSDLTSLRKLRELKVDLGDGGEYLAVTVDKEKAEVGQYQLEISKLATRHSVITQGITDPDAPLFGIGTISLELENGETSLLSIREDSSSLRGIASLINRHPHSPVRASVIRDDQEGNSDRPWKLILTSKKEGVINRFDTPQFNFPNAEEDLSIEAESEGQNSHLSLDDFEIETERNDIPDFLPGVNFHLKQAAPDRPFQITITEDHQKITAKVKAALDQVNQILQFIYKQNAIDAQSDTSTTFAGDSTLQSIEYQIRNLIHSTYEIPDADEEDLPTRFNLSDLGIQIERSGLIGIKEERFTQALEQNFEFFSQIITGENGFANRLLNVIRSYNQPNQGLLANKEKGLRSRIKQIDDQIETKTRSIDQKKEALVNQFARLESTLSKMQKQQQYLSTALPGANAGMAQLISGR